MATLYTLAETNIRKTYFYLFLFSLLIIFVAWFCSYYFESPIILYIGIIYSVVSSFISFWWSDKIVLFLSQAKPIKKEDNPELYRLVENLCITAGLPMPKIYLIDDESPNAFATGRDPSHSVIVVTRGLLEFLERAELEGVIAHELSHIGNRDTLLMTMVTIMVGIIVFLTDFIFRNGFRIRVRRTNRDEGLGLVIIVLGLLFFLLSSLIAQLIKFAISRKREFLADASGALLTRYPEGLARALEKISKNKDILEAANHATAHLYIINPFKEDQKKSLLTKLFSTHPPVEERIKALRDMSL